MKYSGRNSLSAYLKIFIVLIMAVAAVVIIGLPIFFKMYLEWLDIFTSNVIGYNYLLTVLYITGIASFILLNELRKIFNTLENCNPFVIKNVKSLKRISILCFLIGIVYTTKIFVLNSFMTLIIVFIFIVCGFFALILSDVFNQAVKYKDDNDLTI